MLKANESQEQELVIADITRNETYFTKLIRHEVLNCISMLAHDDYEGIVEAVDVSQMLPNASFPARDIEKIIDPYYDEHERIRLDPGARASHHTRLTTSDDGTTVTIEQTLVDPDDYNDWVCVFSLSVPEAKEKGEVNLSLLAIRSLAEI